MRICTANISSTEFVAWYSGHPDQHGRTITLDAEAVAVIGVGNVAIDVTRILAKHVDELRTTDVPEYVLDALAVSRVRDIYLIGRRGPAQAKFTTPELRELGEIPNADVIIDPRDLELDEASAKTVAGKSALQRNLDVLRELASRKPEGRPRRIHLKFLASPVEIKGTDRVREIVLERNRLDERENAVGTGVKDNIAAGDGIPRRWVSRDSAARFAVRFARPRDSESSRTRRRRKRCARERTIRRGLDQTRSERRDRNEQSRRGRNRARDRRGSSGPASGTRRERGSARRTAAIARRSACVYGTTGWLSIGTSGSWDRSTAARSGSKSPILPHCLPGRGRRAGSVDGYL